MFSRTIRRSFLTSTRSSVPIKHLTTPRQLSTSSRMLAEDTMDKDSVKPEAQEYSKSGSDDGAAVSDTAFDPSTTSPEESRDAAGSNTRDGSDPLDVSPANPEVSKRKGAAEGASGGSAAESKEGNSERSRTSGGGSPAKNG